jgi:hypothetical protein
MFGSKEEIERLVRSVAAERFSDEHVAVVDVSEDVSDDGDDILVIRIVLETEKAVLSGSKTSGFLRHLRPKLFELKEDRFPLVSFATKKVKKGHRPEAA